ncbi:hypothetical protein P8452_18467 [Trifolium repens]|nr:hypothetical protein P8452_18467 [Trifolium repens]
MASSSNETRLREKISVVAKMPEVKSLIEFGKLLEGKHRTDFDHKYGKILNLIEVNVQGEAITALCQFYDPPFRCFTFKDFQMAPTLEEYEQILGYSLENVKPYYYTGNYPSPKRVASILRVKEDKLKSHINSPHGVDLVKLSFLEERLKSFSEEGDWASFTDVLALAIYGTVLFPNTPEYIDFAAIDIFLAVKNEGRNPVPTVLADTYYTLDFCHMHKNNRKKIICCLPALYVWLITHIFHSGLRALCPIVDFMQCSVESKSKDDWANYLTDLNERTVRWYPNWREVNMVIYRCGTFPNVPLMGTKGCINYNPSLALRQLCYSIMDSPEKDLSLTTPFIVHGINNKDIEEHRRIRAAWKKITHKGSELGKRSTDAHDRYRQWVKNRVCEIKLPFRGSPSIEQEIPEPTPGTNEEVGEFETTLLKLEEEKRELQDKLEKVSQENRDLRLDNTRKNEEVEEFKTALLKLQEEKMELQEKLEKLSQENRELRLDNTSKNEEVGTSNKRAKLE